jgi:hypothetical protein
MYEPAIELKRMLMDSHGRLARGLQNRLRVVRGSPFKFASVRHGPLKATSDSQRQPRFARGQTSRSTNLDGTI